ncbi:hyaluronate lyase [Niastella yeongjuensis]|uniref:Hyaluronate lyase n=1 Tax=Niastella yeongjuensis TaxID=354355 RepID=A0A1V9EYV2_9BACT|nr:Gfo/Idh/MocA family oxidoreductase [Niastella yeongjuensis]OQP51248.1 hyaluronate lyase [Niastella yeongjuensis]SEP39527.1 Predicted dehydrogenase [Niastella yeongjuensis]
MSRRHFIKQSGILAGGLLLSNQMVQAFAGTADKINIGIIGCGDRGTGIMNMLKDLADRFSVTAVCDILDFRVENAKKALPSSNLKVYKDYRQLLDDKSIQAVVIAVTLSEHYHIAKDALAAGKHIYLEKAMTYSIDQSLDLVKTAKAHSGQIVQIGHQYRSTPLYFKVKEMIDKGYLGKVTQIDSRWDRNWNWRRPVPTGYSDKQVNWRMYREYSGGLPAELLSHQMDFINWAFNTHPDEILGTGGIDFYKDGRETYDNVQVMLRYSKDNMIGNFGATCGNAHDGYIFKIKGTKGAVHLLMHEGVYYPEPTTKKELQTVDGVTGATKIEWNKDGGIPIIKEDLKDGTYYALVEFHESIINKKLPSSNIVTGATTAICVALANSAIYNHTIEKWKPAYNIS